MAKEFSPNMYSAGLQPLASPTGRILDDKWLDRFEHDFGPVARGLGRLIRPTIIAKPGRTLIWGDYSAIEARVLPWLADSPGAEKVLDIFRTNDADPSLPDIYKIEAGHIFEKDPTEIAKGPERQTGKVAVLSLGFGGSDGALLNMATNYGIYLGENLRKHIIETWRANNRWAVHFWGKHTANESYGLWGAFNQALENPDTIIPVGKVAYVYDRSYLGGTVLCALPDGRRLTYPDVRVRDYVIKNDDGSEETKRGLTYRKSYGFSGLWYGKLAENITQATAASLLRKLLVRLVAFAETREYRDWLEVIGHTHDEGVLHVAEELVEEGRELLHKEMMRELPWTAGLPLAVEITDNWYYSKAVGD